VVAAQQEEVLGELEFVAEQQHDALDRILAPINIITNEQIVAVPGVAAVFEYLEQVAELPVDVA
jgi:hypothetical protein